MIVTGAASLIRAGNDDAPLDPSPYLLHKETRKFMGTQDDLAVLTAGLALARAGIGKAELGERAGLFAVVGYIPFNHADIAPVLAASVEGDRFSMQRFSNGGFQQAHPLLTFRCLPNMPAYHVSANFDVRGPYFVTYPGPAQFYAALEEAVVALEQLRIDVALVLAVAHQRNFLVEHHFQRMEPAVAARDLRDVGACLVLEREPSLRRPLLRLCEQRQNYQPHAAFEPMGEVEQFSGVEPVPGELGPAGLSCALVAAIERGESRRVRHDLQSRDRVHARSEWQVLP
ncbi:MAG: beta-ketoacyl synthase N-terminal-like domain-containing protein [Polyangiaceae bacterium]